MNKHMTQEVAIKSAWMILEGLGYDRARNGDLEKTVAAVFESAPAADVVEVRHGRWLPVQLGDMRCSLCGEVYGVCGGLLGDYNYCPSCGAKMDGGQDE